MACEQWPEGRVDEDGADEPSCEWHRTFEDHKVHTMSNGLVRITDENGVYVDSVDTVREALEYIAHR